MQAPVGDFERFITPHQGQSRELSFSDLLSGPGRAHVSPRLRSLSPVGLTPAPPAAPEHHHHHLLPRELSNADSAVSPRKRPRKSTAPQRSGFGSGDSFSYDDAVAQPMAPRSGQGETCGSACLDDGAPAHTSPVRRSGRK